MKKLIATLGVAAILLGSMLALAPVAQAATVTLGSGQVVSQAEFAAKNAAVKDYPAPSAAVLKAASANDGDFVVDSVSAGPGAYCIPDWGWDLAPNPYGVVPNGAGTGNGWWKAFVARGQYASWIPACLHDGDTDGVWIDNSHFITPYLWICQAGFPYTCAWTFWGTIASNHDFQIHGAQAWLFKVGNGHVN